MGTSAYPRPRVRAGGSPGGVGPAAPAIPGFRVWPFRIGAGVVNTRTIAVSPGFQGPALITNVSFSWGTAATTGVGFGLFWSDDNSGAGQNLAPTTRPTGTPIFEPISFVTPAAADTDELREHFDQTQAGFTNPQPVSSDIKYYIARAGQFFLKATVRNGAAGTFDMKGLVNIIENITPEMLLNF